MDRFLKEGYAIEKQIVLEQKMFVSILFVYLSIQAVVEKIYFSSTSATTTVLI
jgi:hypothetical protein